MKRDPSDLFEVGVTGSELMLKRWKRRQPILHQLTATPGSTASQYGQSTKHNFPIACVITAWRVQNSAPWYLEKIDNTDGLVCKGAVT